MVKIKTARHYAICTESNTFSIIYIYIKDILMLIVEILITLISNKE